MLRHLRRRTESMYVLFLSVVAILLVIAFLNTIGARHAAGIITSGLVIFGIMFAASGKHHMGRRH